MVVDPTTIVGPNRAIAAAFRSLRALHDLTQPDLARRMRTAQQTLRSIERGDYPAPRKYVLALCNATGVTLDEFSYMVELFNTSEKRLEQTEAE